MFFYLIHSSPLWIDLENGKRNVRTFLAGIVCYILLHAFLYSSYGSESQLICTFRNYIWYIILADCAAVATLYRMHYGRSILKEITPPHF